MVACPVNINFLYYKELAETNEEHSSFVKWDYTIFIPEVTWKSSEKYLRNTR
jgi:hypothetical protein